MTVLTRHELLELLLKATNWEQYATAEEILSMPMSEAKSRVLNRLINQEK